MVRTLSANGRGMRNLASLATLTVLTATVACNSSTPSASLYMPADCVNVTPAATAASGPSGPAAAPLTTAEQLDIFDQLVRAVMTAYIYPDFHGVDWPSIAAGYRARVQAGLDTTAFYDVMTQLIRSLADGHSSFLTPAVVTQQQQQAGGDLTSVRAGFDLIILPSAHKAVVTSVVPGSPAAHSGIRAHDSILAVDGHPTIGSDGRFSPLLHGARCSTETLTVESPGAESRKVVLVRDSISGPVLLDTRLVPTTDGSRVGYIFLPTFDDATIPGQISEALTRFGHLDSLILDVRTNPGGLEPILTESLGYFTSGHVGRFVSRSSSRVLTVISSPNDAGQSIPLVVLIGPHTYSAAEFFAGILRDVGRARLIGGTTSGLLQSLHVIRFQDGSQAWLAEERFDPAVSHADWAKTGIVPDVRVDAEWDSFTFQNDPAIASALTLLART